MKLYLQQIKKSKEASQGPKNCSWHCKEVSTLQRDQVMESSLNNMDETVECQLTAAHFTSVLLYLFQTFEAW